MRMEEREYRKRTAKRRDKFSRANPAHSRTARMFGVLMRKWNGPRPGTADQGTSTGLKLWAIILAMALLPGCSGLLSGSAAPDYYQLDCLFQPSACPESFPGTVRIWPFNATAPYDGEQMIVVSASSRVRPSSHYKWVAPAGNMIADNLMRDFSLGAVFEDTIPVGNPIPAAYGISGQVYRFALEESNPSPHAVLDLEVSLWQEKPARAVMFRKHFHYQSPPLSAAGPEEFASAMAALVSQLSKDLRNDLCTIKKDNSHPAGG